MELAAKPDAEALEARVELAALRRLMFGGTAAVEVGRHRLLELLGRGAHGSVFEAEDAELGRRIAVKVIARDLADVSTHEGLVSEARAMAQLNHPNVVTVYDAGVTDDRLWIAMELVRGSTLQAWAEQHPAGTTDRFEQARLLLAQAGSGLAAAHAAGLVHRDFKPANVLLGEDGRAQVGDFGLARAWQQGAHPCDPLDPRTHQSMDDTVTAVAGTPRYMSPEQIRGSGVDHRSDQFNFAVTAWELAYGVLPHDGDNLQELLTAMESGPPALASTPGVPRWYGRALRRALMPDPERRFPSMDALVSALDPATRRRRVAFGTAAMVVGVASAAAVAWTRAPVGTPCDLAIAQSEVEPVWDDSRREQLDRALEQRQLTAPLIEGLDQYAQTWATQHVATCEARWIDRSIEDDQLDARMACLRRSLATMDATLVRLESESSEVLARALGMVKELPDPLACADSDETPPQDPAVVERLVRPLASAEADRIAGRYAPAADRGIALAEDAIAAGADLLAADALEIAGRALAERDDPRRFSLLERAHGLATAAGADRRATRLAIALALQHTYVWHIEDGKRWLRHARAGLVRRPDPELELATRHAEGLWHLKRHEVSEALAIWEPLADELAHVRSSDSETAWLLRADLVLLYGAVDRRDEAIALGLSQLEQTREDLGAAHPRIGRLSSTLTQILAKDGDDEAATLHAERALAVSRQAYGPINRRTAIAQLHLGLLEHRRGLHDDAKRSYLAAIEACGDARDEWKARAYRDLGRLYADLGDLAPADDAFRHAVSIGGDVWEAERDELLALRRHRAGVWIELGRIEQAQAELERIADIAMRAAHYRQAVRTLATIAELHDDAEHPDEAAATRERISQTCRRHAVDAPECR